MRANIALAPAGALVGWFVPRITFGSTDQYSQNVLIQPDGKLLLSGYCGAAAQRFCLARFEGGPFGYQNCSMDLDGDGMPMSANDALIHARVSLGLTGSAVVNGIAFAATAKRNTWLLIRDYLVSQCGMSLLP